MNNKKAQSEVFYFISFIIAVILLVFGISFCVIYLPLYLAEDITGYSYCEGHNNLISFTVFDCGMEDNFGDISGEVKTFKLNLIKGEIIDWKYYY